MKKKGSKRKVEDSIGVKKARSEHVKGVEE
jgi:hypothetical protein